jgi:cysteine desulfurase/selenocysteine lyase
MKILKKDFPIFSSPHGHPDLVYCDSAAGSQKPRQVIDRIDDFYRYEYAPIARGVYTLAEKATEHYEQVRIKVQEFIGAEHLSEVVFTKGATEGINLIAYSWGLNNLTKGDEIVLTELEHHANILPWQFVAQQTGAVIKWIPVTSEGDLDYEQVTKIITKKAKLVAVSAWSNVLGIEIDLDTIIQEAKKVGARVLIDAAQAAPRMRLNAHQRGCDFLVFSGHKMLSGSGVGVLYVRSDLHARLTPFEYGGGMVFSVNQKQSKWRDMPHRLEAGSQSAAQVLGLGRAIDYLQHNVDFVELREHEAALCSQLLDGLEDFKQIRVLGPLEKIRQGGSAVTFVVKDMHAHDVAAHFDTYQICVRAGNHCAQPLHDKLGIANSVRVSFYLYNTSHDVDAIVVALSALLG